MTYGWIWIALIIVCAVLEFFTRKNVAIWFIPSAIAALVIDLFYANILLQLAVCLVPALVAIILSELVFRKSGEVSALGFESVIGERCVVVERIDTFAGCGEVKVNGQVWSARGVLDDDTYEEGAILRIVAIEGVKLICRK